MTKTYRYTFTHVPRVFTKGCQVLLAVFFKQKLFLARKEIYPLGIYRLLGGGKEKGETIKQAAVRELKEETGLDANFTDLTQKIKFIFYIKESVSNKVYRFESNLFYLSVDKNNLFPSDDVDEIKLFDLEKMNLLVNTYNQLSDKLTVTRGNECFRWKDYGKIFGVIHRYVACNWLYSC